jgi:hypothetical protein
VLRAAEHQDLSCVLQLTNLDYIAIALYSLVFAVRYSEDFDSI